MTHISRVKIYNIKCIRESDIELKPLTIFVGPNASGKSTILYSIYWFYLKIMKNSGLNNFISDTERNFFNIKSYDDLCSGRDLRKVWMGIDLEFDLSKIEKELRQNIEAIDWNSWGIKKPGLNKILIGFKIHRNIHNKLDYEYYIKTNRLNISIKNWYDVSDDRYIWLLSGPFKAMGKDYLYYEIFSRFDLSRRISEYKKTLEEEESLKLRKIDKVLYTILTALKDNFLKETFMITPLRGNIPLSAESKLTRSIECGEDVLKALAFAYTNYNLRVKRKLGSMLTLWAERLGIRDLTAGLDDEGRIRATFEDLKTFIDLAMASYGQRQLITFLTQLIISPPHSLIMIEEPEISLHPQSQALLPLLFAEVIKKHNKQVLVTTHSSILVLALSDAVMGSDEYPDIPRLNVDEIAVYHVVRDKNDHTKIEHLKLTKEGFVEGGIPSFVSVETKLYGKILSRLKKKA